mmetsp:Transcript_81984/g.171598  ORF Transcript_81984/g.171598 Transcript_81984/m.171598 type:complete len:226 (-) Transcript_81984:254-931(-)
MVGSLGAITVRLIVEVLLGVFGLVIRTSIGRLSHLLPVIVGHEGLCVAGAVNGHFREGVFGAMSMADGGGEMRHRGAMIHDALVCCSSGRMIMACCRRLARRRGCRRARGDGNLGLLGCAPLIWAVHDQVDLAIAACTIHGPVGSFRRIFVIAGVDATNVVTETVAVQIVLARCAGSTGVDDPARGTVRGRHAIRVPVDVLSASHCLVVGRPTGRVAHEGEVRSI